MLVKTEFIWWLGKTLANLFAKSGFGAAFQGKPAYDAGETVAFPAYGLARASNGWWDKDAGRAHLSGTLDVFPEVQVLTILQALAHSSRVAPILPFENGGFTAHTTPARLVMPRTTGDIWVIKQRFRLGRALNANNVDVKMTPEFAKTYRAQISSVIRAQALGMSGAATAVTFFLSAAVTEISYSFQANALRPGLVKAIDAVNGSAPPKIHWLLGYEKHANGISSIPIVGNPAKPTPEQLEMLSGANELALAFVSSTLVVR
jgi:ribosomal protein S9